MAKESVASMSAGSGVPHEAPRKRRFIWRRCGCMALVGLVVLICVGIASLRYVIRSRFEDDTWSAMQRAHTEVIDLGPAWQQPTPIPPDSLLEFQAELDARLAGLFERHEEMLFGDYTRSADLLSNMRRGNPLPAEHVTSYSMFLDEMADVVDLTSAAVSQKNYTMELGFQSASGASFLTLQTLTKYSGIVALEHARQGNCKAAIDIALLPVRTLRRGENARSISHLIATAVVAISTGNVTAVADQCTDTLALRYGFNQMRQLREVAFPGDMDNWRYGDAIGPLQRAASYGYPVDLSPKPLTEFYIDTAHMGARFDDWIIANRPVDDRAVSAARERIAYRVEYSDYYKQMEEVEKEGLTGRKVMPVWQRKIAKLLLGVDPVAMFYGNLMQVIDEQMVRMRVAMALYDLARLHLAERLKQLGAPVAPEDMDIETELMSSSGTAETSAAQTLDPFSDAPFPVHQSSKVPYSVGPDRTDQQMGITYDASNGTVSPGDLWVGP